MPDTPIRGSLELITNPHLGPDAENISLPVAAMTPSMAPMFAAMVWGITDLTEAPLDEANGEPVGNQVAVWTGTGAQLRPVKCVLWAEAPPQPREIEEDV